MSGLSYSLNRRVIKEVSKVIGFTPAQADRFIKLILYPFRSQHMTLLLKSSEKLVLDTIYLNLYTKYHKIQVPIGFVTEVV